MNGARGVPAAPRIVAVAGSVGAGKTTLVRALGQHLGAVVIHFDDYERITLQSPADMARWIEAGASFDELVVGELPRVLGALKAGQAVPGHDGAWLQPTPHIVLETQLGRQHTATGRYIDHMIWLDLPADVALARKLQQLAGMVRAGESQGFVGWLQRYLVHYQAMVAPLLAKQKASVAPEADITLDALQPPEQVLAGALQALGAGGTAEPT